MSEAKAKAAAPRSVLRCGSFWLVVAIAALAGALSLVQVAAGERPARDVSGPTTQVVGGKPVAIGADSFMAHLQITVGERIFGCGGTVIDATHVLTAAHCAVEAEADALPPEAFAVTVGSTLLSEAGPENVYEVAGVEVHPSYDPLTHAYDAAVLTLAAPIENPNVEPIPLVAIEGKVRKAKHAKVAGWGLRAFNVPASASDHLREASLKITGPRACRKAFRGAGVRVSKATMLCGYAKGRDACQGDSGGPLFRRTANGPIQVGITSFGIGCAFEGIPGVFTRLSDPSIGGFVRDAIASP